MDDPRLNPSRHVTRHSGATKRFRHVGGPYRLRFSRHETDNSREPRTESKQSLSDNDYYWRH